ncbi:MAG: 16S rRNA (cytosine(1402)-N(4))-methyltransferase RsmH [Bacillota bacterium]|jgi:16S rRNA (cytosine1402-N4)-methyltransferase|nr:16S rRNA (cytosine(1402)-N(4))-methyltransferase RsmH [Candidatus Fermentithermobacillaceae bacterium]HOA70449.1 16S rRNA (cytosine(1402)-N(4))-methyltransferase RsmH [Bacillota bacterium]HOP70692.1 16S rRNA (cytosine(1402)-N(4))-methyltransferase RsmH [Bacillota bacterium]HPZ85268.1 16S rRNA (cytosine(1402)-N(4))-methyltransferase RsmH [Bacillota bacterium]
MMDRLDERIYHKPVMVREVLEFVTECTRSVVVDCTLGDGGHSYAILDNTQDTFVLGIDIDDEAVAVAGKRLNPVFGGRFHPSKGDYRELNLHLARVGIPRVSGILIDLGVSSRQLDQAHRGFSYWAEAPLDMRMNPQSTTTAKDIVAYSSEEELERILREYGEERYSRQIAKAIVEHRDKHPIETTTELVQIIQNAIPSRVRYRRLHPARKTFQALRIAVNDELSRLDAALRRCFSLLEAGGVLMVITYHSLEDRIAKRVFRELEAMGPGLVRTKKVIRPSEAEVADNPRARSGKLRVIQRRDVGGKGNHDQERGVEL